MEHVAKTFKFPFEIYQWIMSQTDPRTKNLPLCGKPLLMLSIIFCYVYFVKVAGPQWMKNRPPFKIERLIALYNVLMVLLTAYLFVVGGSLTYLWPWGRYNWICQSINYGYDPDALKLVNVCWWLLLLKIFEFADTIFFVLRKKFTHISALHVIHHSLVVWGMWLGLNFGNGGNNAFFPFINCFVHTIMYFYYCLASLGPGMRKYLWWKQYLTILQMIQFVIVIAHAMVPLFYDCGYPRSFSFVIMALALLFLVLFLNFYQHAYNGQNRKAAEAAQIKLTALKAIESSNHDYDEMAIQHEVAKIKVSDKDL